MTPPRTPDADGGASVDEYAVLCDEIAQTQGIVNVAETRLVGLTVRALALGVSGGDNLPPKAWLAWRAGISPERSSSIVKIAERAEQLPNTMAALEAGELTVDQAAVIARHVPARFEASAARVAPFMTVAQLRSTLPHYRDRKPKPERGDPADPEAHGHVSSHVDEAGHHIHVLITDLAKGAIVDRALKAMHEDLKRLPCAAPGWVSRRR